MNNNQSRESGHIKLETMKKPSKKLEQLSLEKPDILGILGSWARILNSLTNLGNGYIKTELYLSLESHVGSNFQENPEGWGDPELIFQVFVGGDVDVYVKNLSEQLYAMEDVCATFNIGNKADLQGRFLGKRVKMSGTWEQVARKLFELEMQIMAQIPDDVRLSDLKKQKT